MKVMNMFIYLFYNICLLSTTNSSTSFECIEVDEFVVESKKYYRINSSSKKKIIYIYYIINLLCNTNEGNKLRVCLDTVYCWKLKTL